MTQTTLKAARLAQGLSQQELAALIGRSTTFLSNIEGGEATLPAQMVAPLAKALRLSEHEVRRYTAESLSLYGLSPEERAAVKAKVETYHKVRRVNLQTT